MKLELADTFRIYHKHIKVEFIEVELDPSSSSQSDSHEAAVEVISAGIKKLDMAIHRIVDRRSAPVTHLQFVLGWTHPPSLLLIIANNRSTILQCFPLIHLRYLALDLPQE
ncbi:Uncharacterized protein Fot_22018 [Forsythia ovata]|uniref:Uncharacterized protein n=1 Tax=Forsythia ovata TaxID=205694 RepID=A0ABD1UWT3_9LAMI